jgi:hypothetical protein
VDVMGIVTGRRFFQGPRHRWATGGVATRTTFREENEYPGFDVYDLRVQHRLA